MRYTWYTCTHIHTYTCTHNIHVIHDIPAHVYTHIYTWYTWYTCTYIRTYTCAIAHIIYLHTYRHTPAHTHTWYTYTRDTHDIPANTCHDTTARTCTTHDTPELIHMIYLYIHTCYTCTDPSKIPVYTAPDCTVNYYCCCCCCCCWWRTCQSGHQKRVRSASAMTFCRSKFRTFSDKSWRPKMSSRASQLHVAQGIQEASVPQSVELVYTLLLLVLVSRVDCTMNNFPLLIPVFRSP